MKLVKASNGKTKITLSKKEWEQIGKTAGWDDSKNIESPVTEMRVIRVTFEDGNTMTTNINGTDEEIKEYYVGKYFNFGDTDSHPKDKMVKAVGVAFLD